MAGVKAKYRDTDQQFLDVLNGMVCATLASINGVKDAKPVDFMITKREPEKKVTTIEEIDQQFKTWAAMTRGR